MQLTADWLIEIVAIEKHCEYLQKHRDNIFKAWDILKEKCKYQKESGQCMSFISDDFLWFTIDGLVKSHDISKLSKEEFIPYCHEFFIGKKNQAKWHKKEFEKAVEHHKSNNLHHWENWTNREFYHPDAKTCHCVCMVIDWMAMGMEFGDTAEEYYEKNKEKIKLPDWAVDFCHEIFLRLRGSN